MDMVEHIAFFHICAMLYTVGGTGGSNQSGANKDTGWMPVISSGTPLDVPDATPCPVEVHLISSYLAKVCASL